MYEIYLEDSESKARFFFYYLIYKPSYCNFLESRNKIKFNF